MNGNVAPSLGIASFAIFLVAAGLSFALLLFLRPLLQRYALAHPNARSSHTVPTAQGGGVGVIVATIATVAGASTLFRDNGDTSLWFVLAAASFIAVVGAIDDVSPIPVLPRLLLQAIAVIIILEALPEKLWFVPVLPYWIEKLFLGFAILWFVNLVNFMDGIDWMTVAEVIPITAGVALIDAGLSSPQPEFFVALALCGGIVGFAPFNRPIAKLFLGDVGSLAIGLLVAWLLVGLARHGHIAAALLLPLYYLADATLTLIRRAARGEPIWQAHRTHFYQRAIERGLTVMAVVGRVFVVNVALAVLAIVSVLWSGLAVQLVTLAFGAALVCWLLLSLGGDGKPTVLAG
jgi:UDP-N-acetylmuramyl pentapeptide phosphotransferase/UDP-N-acetylglucosamine-1-phosphate transferase